MNQEKKPYKEIGERLENFRKHLDIPRKTFSEKLELTIQHYNNLAIGARMVSSRTLIQLIESFDNVNASWILTGKGSMLIPENLEEIDKEIHKYEIQNELLRELLEEKRQKEMEQENKGE